MEIFDIIGQAIAIIATMGIAATGIVVFGRIAWDEIQQMKKTP